MNKIVKLFISHILCFFLCTPLYVVAESKLSKVFHYSNILFVYDGLERKDFVDKYIKRIVEDIADGPNVKTEIPGGYSDWQIYDIPERHTRFLMVNRGDINTSEQDLGKGNIGVSKLREFARNTTYIIYVWNKKSTLDSRFSFFDRFYQLWSEDECNYQFGGKTFNLGFKITNDRYIGDNFAETTIRVRNGCENAIKPIFIFDGILKEYNESVNCECEPGGDFCNSSNCRNKSKKLIEANIQGDGPYYGYEHFIDKVTDRVYDFEKPGRMFHGQSQYSWCGWWNPLTWCKSPKLAYVTHDNWKKKFLFALP